MLCGTGFKGFSAPLSVSPWEHSGCDTRESEKDDDAIAFFPMYMGKKPDRARFSETSSIFLLIQPFPSEQDDACGEIIN